MPEQVAQSLNPCPFCALIQKPTSSRIIAQNNKAFLVRDGFPVTLGHSLIIPKRHIQSFFETTESEKTALMELLAQAKADIDQEYKPDGYNIGINDGIAAGQTVLHLHIHLIPRYHTQNTDPRGGVRWVIPEKADYWSD